MTCAIVNMRDHFGPKTSVTVFNANTTRTVRVNAASLRSAFLKRMGAALRETTDIWPGCGAYS